MRALATAIGLLLMTPLSILAHHSFAAEFDLNKPVELRGVVTKVDWINPHAWIYLDVKDEKGKVTTWAVEGGAPNSLLRRGFRRDSVPVGTAIVIRGYRAKNGKPVANGRNVMLANGRNLFMGSSGTGAPDEPK